MNKEGLLESMAMTESEQGHGGVYANHDGVEDPLRMKWKEKGEDEKLWHILAVYSQRAPSNTYIEFVVYVLRCALLAEGRGERHFHARGLLLGRNNTC